MCIVFEGRIYTYVKFQNLAISLYKKILGMHHHHKFVHVIHVMVFVFCTFPSQQRQFEDMLKKYDTRYNR